MTDDFDDKYPHWRDALFGNHNAVANLRCAAHYVAWHTVYVFVGIIGAVLVGGIKTAKLLARVLGPIGRPIIRALSRVEESLEKLAKNERVNDIGFGLLLLGFAGSLLYVLGVLVWLAYTQFWNFMKVFGSAAFAAGVLLSVPFIASKLSDPTSRAVDRSASAARSAGEKAVQTPGIRRVYGRCPVNMDQPPKWFDNMIGANDD
jgi:hypothetical protein